MSSAHPTRRARLGSALLVLVCAAVSGVMLYASFQPIGLWWAAPLGMAVFFLILTPRNALWAAWIQGAVTFLLLLPWVGEFVGWYAWVALAAIQSLYNLLFGLGLRWLLRSPRMGHSALAVFSSSIAMSCWFVATEYLRSSWPFGGFPWGRLAWGQVGGPLAWWIRLGGPAVVSFLVVLSGVCIAWGLWSLASLRLRRIAPVQILAPALVILLVVYSVGLYFQFTLAVDPSSTQAAANRSQGTVRVAAIQGNVPRLGLDFAAQRQAVLNNHAHQTGLLADAISSGQEPQPDVVIWPENASDLDPYTHQEAADIISSEVTAVGAPIVLGTVTPKYNRMVVWDDNGPGEVHNKRFLQPFGEYMPFRDLLRTVTPLVDRAGDFQPGTDNGVVHANGIALGLATCYEISFDAALRDAVVGGAKLLATPTNNATFGFTDMTYQQLAMSRMRAMELDRSLVVAATSGVSAIVLPDGQVVQSSAIFEARTLTATLPLRDTMTPSAVVGPWVQWVLSALGVCCVAGGIILGIAQKKPGKNHGKNY